MEDGSGISEEEQQLMIMMMMSSSSNSSSKGKQLPFSSSSTSASSFHDQHQPRQQLVPAAASRPTNTLLAAEPLEANEVEEEEEEEEAAGHGVQRESNVVIEKEHMFDKVVTPSDVGKLNRLVIPKQHAEKYFPLDSSTNEKGLLLNFEDRNGKPWRFRYSYWNSSQSYVMTKGWSRFVKDKKLDAGDIVSFQRGVGEFGRDKLFIDWRRRHDAPDPTISSSSSHPHQHHHQYPFSSNFAAFSWNTTSTSSPSILMRPSAPILTRNVNYLYWPNNPSPSRSIAYYNRPVTCSTGGAAGLYGYSGGYNSYNCINSPNNNNNSAASTVFYMRHATAVGPQVEQRGRQQQQRHQGLGGGGLVGGKGAVVVEPMVFESVPVVQGKAAAKRLRLFGVNMDCPMATTSNSDSEDNLSLATSTTATSTTTCTNGRMFSVEAPHPPSQQQYPLQLRLHNGTPLLPTSAPHFIRKGKSSSSSTYLDLESSDDT